MKRSQIVFILLFFLFQWGLIWIFPYPPLQDYPNHLARVHIFLHSSSSMFRDYYQSGSLLIPNVSSDLVIAGLGLLLPMLTAGKIFLSLLVTAIPLSFYFLCRRVNPTGQFHYYHLMFPVFLSLSSFFVNGNLNFCFSIALFCLFVGYIAGVEEFSYRQFLVLAILCLIIYFSHLVTFGAVLLSLLVFSIHRRRLWLSLAGLPSMGCLGIFIYQNLHNLLDSPFVENTMQGLRKIVFVPYWEKYFPEQWTGSFFSFNATIDQLIGFIVMVMLCLGLLWTRYKKLEKKELWVLTILLILCYKISPLIMLPVYNVPVRFMVLALLLGAAIVKFPPGVLPQVGYILGLCVIVWLGYQAYFWQETQRPIQGYLQVIEDIRYEKSILPIELVNAGYVSFDPFAHLWAYELIRKGGYTPYLFASPYQPVKYRQSIVAPTFWNRDESVRAISHEYNQYDYILINGGRREVPQFILDGIASDYLLQKNIGNTYLFQKIAEVKNGSEGTDETSF